MEVRAGDRKKINGKGGRKVGGGGKRPVQEMLPFMRMSGLTNGRVKPKYRRVQTAARSQLMSLNFRHSMFS